MSYVITIFDIGEVPMSNHPVALLNNSSIIEKTTTDANGVATFNYTFSSGDNLSVCSQQKNPMAAP